MNANTTMETDKDQNILELIEPAPLDDSVDGIEAIGFDNGCNCRSRAVSTGSGVGSFNWDIDVLGDNCVWGFGSKVGNNNSSSRGFHISNWGTVDFGGMGDNTRNRNGLGNFTRVSDSEDDSRSSLT
ncbi:hypothetical protein WICPIJ_004479 [Wickerhamomyces pijperi]|uniref:Uncharacterized protein n=1 Tax=Wickerhamomyces pijperi TaxID=599730 RepID=A0A9P8TMX0_WICPI|nr:hypothetical protein WICPIJ_004479 [Wickerhamomyces pijperi]